MKKTISLILALVLSLPLGMTAASAAWYDDMNDPLEMTALLPEHPQRPVLEDYWNTYEVRMTWLGECTQNWPWSESYQSVYNEMEELVAELTRDKHTETEKAKAVFDWIAKNITYSSQPILSSPVHTFYQKRGICTSYMNLSQLMMVMAGLPAAEISGIAATGAGHGWNAVYADGAWIHFDVTWDRWNIAPDFHKKVDSITFQDGPFTCYIQSPTSIETRSVSGYGFPEAGRVTVPAYVTELSGSLSYCTDLSYIDVEKDNPFYQSIDGVVYSKDGKTLVAYPMGSQTVHFTVPDGVTTIGMDSFAYQENKKLASVILPNSVTSIQQNAFFRNKNIQSIVIPGSVTEISSGVFYDCSNLTVYGEARSRAQTAAKDEGVPFKVSSQFVVPGAQTAAAAPTNDKLEVNGSAADPTVYKIDGSNYFKIRDVAALLNGTEKQFAVGYDNEKKSVTAATGQGYTKLDTDLLGAPSGENQTATPSNDVIYVNGEKIEAEVYKIGGANYFKLRDLGKALNFYVGWSKDRGMYIETDKGYTE